MNFPQKICEKYGEIYLPDHEEPVLTGFPTVLFEVEGKEHPIVYEKARNLESLITLSDANVLTKTVAGLFEVITKVYPCSTLKNPAV